MLANWKSKYIALSDRFSARKKRERVLVGATAIITTFFVLDVMIVKPISNAQELMEQKIASNLHEQKSIHTLAQSGALNKIIDPDAENKRKLQDLTASIEVSDRKLSSMRTKLVEPSKMPVLLGSILKNYQNLNLVSLKATPIEIPDAKSMDAGNQVALYKHGVEVVVEGPFLDLMHYVSDIENMPWHLVWNQADLQVSKYPTSVLKFNVYTLSTNSALISI